VNEKVAMGRCEDPRLNHQISNPSRSDWAGLVFLCAHRQGHGTAGEFPTLTVRFASDACRRTRTGRYMFVLDSRAARGRSDTVGTMMAAAERKWACLLCLHEYSAADNIGKGDGHDSRGVGRRRLDHGGGVGVYARSGAEFGINAVAGPPGIRRVIRRQAEVAR